MNITQQIPNDIEDKAKQIILKMRYSYDYFICDKCNSMIKRYCKYRHYEYDVCEKNSKNPMKTFFSPNITIENYRVCLCYECKKIIPYNHKKRHLLNCHCHCN